MKLPGLHNIFAGDETIYVNPYHTQGIFISLMRESLFWVLIAERQSSLSHLGTCLSLRSHAWEAPHTWLTSTRARAARDGLRTPHSSVFQVGRELLICPTGCLEDMD